MDDDDVFFVLTHLDGSTKSVPLAEGRDLLTELQNLPGFDNETFIRSALAGKRRLIARPATHLNASSVPAAREWTDDGRH